MGTSEECMFQPPKEKGSSRYTGVVFVKVSTPLKAARLLMERENDNCTQGRHSKN